MHMEHCLRNQRTDPKNQNFMPLKESASERTKAMKAEISLKKRPKSENYVVGKVRDEKPPSLVNTKGVGSVTVDFVPETERRGTKGIRPMLVRTRCSSAGYSKYNITPLKPG